ncbi:SH3 domain-containing protein [candidate division WOR-3 bacterium]|nr:SH3 domain-containing protein [candidate division WOR-3 bacterium]
MLSIIVFSVFVVGTSIHRIEYDNHRHEIDFTEVGPVNIPFEDISPDGLRYDYYGYLPYWVSNSAYQEFDYSLLTHLAYFSVELSASGSIGAIPNQTNFNEIVSLCHPRGVRVHMTFTLFGSSSVSSFLNSSVARQAAVSNITSLVNSRGIEGANIDFEFVTSSVRDSFTLFIRELSNSLHNSTEGRKELYIAMPCVPGWYPGYNFQALADTCDGLFIMAYDYHYSGSSTAGPVSPTFNSSFWGYYAVNTSVGDIINSYGTAREKVILGIPYYGIDWPTETQSAGSSTTGNGSAVIFKNAKANALTYGRLWDDNSSTPWYRYNSTSWHQCWYDDSVSVMLKLEIARDSLLQGAGCWALGYDSGEDDLWNVIGHVFSIEPPEGHYSAEVATAELNVRSGPSSSYPVISQIHSGQKFCVFDRNGNWYKIYFPSGSGYAHGWAYGGDGNPEQYLKGANGNEILLVTASLLNVRSGPTTDSAVLTLVSRGQCFVPDTFSGNWARISLADSNIIGWIHYVSYTTTIPCPEDSNCFEAAIDSIHCSDTVYSGDTFTVSFYLLNTGESPLDSLVLLGSDSASCFYLAGYWQDSFNALTTGIDALPGQYSARYSLMSAPQVNSPQTITEIFRFRRRQTDISQDQNISVTVLPASFVSEVDTEEYSCCFSVKPSSGLFRDACAFETNSPGLFELTVFDISGRIRFSYTGKDKSVEFGSGIPSGVYFYSAKFLENPGIGTITGKVTKTE